MGTEKRTNVYLQSQPWWLRYDTEEGKKPKKRVCETAAVQPKEPVNNVISANFAARRHSVPSILAVCADVAVFLHLPACSLACMDDGLGRVRIGTRAIGNIVDVTVTQGKCDCPGRLTFDQL